MKQLVKMLGDFDPKLSPLPVEPVAQGLDRPTFSVMIPTYHCADVLRKTLESVLAQDPGIEHMQIAVIDNCSTEDHPEEVVKSFGTDRIEFYRNKNNVGMVANFNNCITKSRGKWVHILHGDDWVEHGFYEKIKQLTLSSHDIDAVFTRCFNVSDHGGTNLVKPRFCNLNRFDSRVDHFFYENPIRTPSIVVKREFYEKYGVYDHRLIHVTDWEMWARIAHYGKIVCLNSPLAYYRISHFNLTNKHKQLGLNLTDALRLGAVFAERHTNFDESRFIRRIARLAFGQSRKFRKAGKVDFADANLAIAHMLGFRYKFMTKLPRFILSNLGRLLRR